MTDDTTVSQNGEATKLKRVQIASFVLEGEKVLSQYSFPLDLLGV